jgi:hypothetical protein
MDRISSGTATVLVLKPRACACVNESTAAATLVCTHLNVGPARSRTKGNVLGSTIHAYGQIMGAHELLRTPSTCMPESASSKKLASQVRIGNSSPGFGNSNLLRFKNFSKGCSHRLVI